ncbi:MAG TPA: gamma-glutamylcyclotransferase [Niabella sp.]|nr:gamma-glutamylcyclotransferase [Niabella sp.]
MATDTNTGQVIKGELYEILNAHEWSFVLAQLDDYEGLYPEQEETAQYKRSLIEVALENGQKTQAWAYWYIGDVTGKPVIHLNSMIDYWKVKNK